MMGLELGVKEITTYALSIDNLKRPEDELSSLWNLMDEKFSKILERIDEFRGHNIVIKFIGDLSLMPQNLQKLCAKIVFELQSIRNPVLTCYLAICYTSRDEITTCMKKVLSEVNSGGLYESDIDDKLLQRGLYGSQYPVDMIVRTSGETRLSDFLLWQCSDAVLYFTDILWPEFNQWEMLKSVMYFQYCRMKDPAMFDDHLQKELKDQRIMDKEAGRADRVECFVKLNETRMQEAYKSYS